ncbi:MAG: hypothetical protein L6R37_002379 [Teloschistes peruensis]|nr:MAG: hypothetical protein L6R37_002379 [Teloschistes peruensis]
MLLSHTLTTGENPDNVDNEAPSSDSEKQQPTNSSVIPYSVFSKSSKRWIVFLIALAGFFSPLSANIYFPSLNYLAQDLNVSLELVNLTITAYLVCQGIVPSIVGDIADTAGRRPVYIAAFVVCNTLIVDLHPDSPATASASVSIVRCSVAAIGVSILQFILDSLGPGWTFTLFGGLGAATTPMLWAEWRWGMQWRIERLQRAVEKNRERTAKVNGEPSD